MFLRCLEFLLGVREEALRASERFLERPARASRFLGVGLRGLGFLLGLGEERAERLGAGLGRFARGTRLGELRLELGAVLLGRGLRGLERLDPLLDLLGRAGSRMEGPLDLRVLGLEFLDLREEPHHRLVADGRGVDGRGEDGHEFLDLLSVGAEEHELAPCLVDHLLPVRAGLGQVLENLGEDVGVAAEGVLEGEDMRLRLGRDGEEGTG